MRQAKKIFLTGATGFLGSHFLVNMLGKEIDHAYVLIRGKNDSIRRNKLKTALSKACDSYLSSPKMNDILSKISIINGDITAINFAINVQDGYALSSVGVDQFWHFAASISLESTNADNTHLINVDGSSKAVELCHRLHIPHFIYVSTAYTCGAISGLIPENLHRTDSPFANPYERSKCLAEHIISKECTQKNICFNIFRPSVVIGNSQTKKFDGTSSGLYGLIYALQRLKPKLSLTDEKIRFFCLPNSEINWVPIDSLTKDIKHVFNAGLKSGEIYHLSSTSSPSNKFLINTISQQLGISNLIPTNNNNDKATPLEKLVARRTTYFSPHLNVSPKKFERKIPSRHHISEEDLQCYIEAATRDENIGENLYRLTDNIN